MDKVVLFLLAIFVAYIYAIEYLEESGSNAVPGTCISSTLGGMYWGEIRNVPFNCQMVECMNTGAVRVMACDIGDIPEGCNPIFKSGRFPDCCKFECEKAAVKLRRKSCIGKPK